MISATELAQIAAPARSTGFSTFSGSLGSAKIFSRGASESRGASNGRTSGQLFLAASRAQLPTQRALDSPVYGLSSAPSRGSWARDGAQAEHTTCHGLAPVAAALPSAYRPLQAMATVFTMPSLSRYSRYNKVKIETKAKIVVPYHSRYSWELTQLSRRT